MARLACLRLAFVAPLLLVAAGCSADVQDLFGGGDGSGGSSGSTQTASQTSSTQTGQTSTSGPGSTTTGDTSVTTGDTTASGPSTTTGDPMTTASTTTGPSGPTVDCDGGTCSVDNDQVCCWIDTAETATCGPASACVGSVGSVATAISCQTQDQCPGQICCAHRAFQSGNAPYASAVCSDQCDYPDLYLCEGQNDPGCPSYQDGNGGTIQSFCKPSQLLPPGYFICGFN